MAKQQSKPTAAATGGAASLKGCAPSVEQLIATDLRSLSRLGGVAEDVAQVLDLILRTDEGRRSLSSPHLNIVTPYATISLSNLRRLDRDRLRGTEYINTDSEKFIYSDAPLKLDKRAVSLISGIMAMGSQLAIVERAAGRYASGAKQKAEVVNAVRSFSAGALDTSAVQGFFSRLIKIVGPGQALGIVITVLLTITQIMIAAAQSQADAAERIAFQERLLAAISGPKALREASERSAARTLRIRTDASKASPTIGSLRAGDVVRMLSVEGEWALVRWSSGDRGEVVGWVLAKHLRPIPKEG